ncbi:hypothetical protein AFLA_008901 [Aspergillus flavus NRRL3357]|nr:hypothetical protein AFLA_008901 [Aspergillus flavus NRRL3357]
MAIKGNRFSLLYLRLFFSTINSVVIDSKTLASYKRNSQNLQVLRFPSLLSLDIRSGKLFRLDGQTPKSIPESAGRQTYPTSGALEPRGELHPDLSRDDSLSSISDVTRLLSCDDLASVPLNSDAYYTVSTPCSLHVVNIITFHVQFSHELYRFFMYRLLKHFLRSEMDTLRTFFDWIWPIDTQHRPLQPVQEPMRLETPQIFCQLNNQWQSYYHNKDSRAIRAIQDSLHCCGFRSVKDRAWPFKDRTHDDDACVEQIGYARACLGPWEQEDKGAAWMVLWAAVLILVVKIASSQLNRSPGWMGRANTNRFIRISGAEDQEEGEEHANANGNVGDDRPTHQLPQPGQSTHDDVWSR